MRTLEIRLKAFELIPLLFEWKALLFRRLKKVTEQKFISEFSWI